MERACPPPQPLKESGERSELPQRGPGRIPGRQRIFGIFEAYRTLLIERTVPKKPVFPKKIHLIDDWGHSPAVRPLLATPLYGVSGGA